MSEMKNGVLDVWEIAYCAMDTPDDLLKPWDDPEPHFIDPSIPRHHRITIARFERDLEQEQIMLERCAAANEWTEQAIKNFAIEHDEMVKI